MLKRRVFGRLCTGLKHFRRVASRRKSSYLRFFERRYMKLRDLISIARVVLSVDEVNSIVRGIRVGLAIVDDSIFDRVEVEPKIRESEPKPKYMDNLMTIADNLANYFRILLRDNPRSFREELRRFRK